MSLRMEEHLRGFEARIEEEIAKREAFIRDQVIGTGGSGVVLGLSGGIDSAVTAALATRALGAEQVVGLWMGADSSSVHHRDAKLVADTYGCRFLEVDFSVIVNQFHDVMNASAEALPSEARIGQDNPLVKGNLKPRFRKNAEYWMAALLGYRVANTCNWSETAIGYETKYGDAAGDFSVLGDLVKAEIYILAKHLGMPEPLLTKAPSADLWEGHTDEEELGLSYQDLDTYLCTGEGDQATIGRIDRMFKLSAHKRNPMPMVSIPKYPGEGGSN
ncbi:NAD(+) synthase [Tumebacillus algifaecis]|uniref:NH(3)-dependent NAD(+) synthetase n=1 Tax=Tumebacillus algifaecis TaxID=1214604 RepID=A0A223D0B3_9BACL|nr:NAD(+) synthase [Tumebacillus algifaecis]ASS74776.1 NAD(+) synthase [Tumebacillus algifaecis]